VTRIAIRLLGRLEVAREDCPVLFSCNKARALLVYLAVDNARAHRRDELATLLWPDLPQVAARNNLRQTLHRLRTALGESEDASPFLVTTSEGIGIRSADYWCDVNEFTVRLAHWRAHEHGPDQPLCPACIEHLRRAVELYRGDFLRGFSIPDSEEFETWALFQQEDLHHQALDALNALAAALLSEGDYAGAARYAGQQIELEPWLERAHAQRMRALALDGQRSAALRQFEICRDALAAELSLGPSPKTLALFRSIRDDCLTARPQPAQPAARFAAERVQPGVCDPGRFVARRRELAWLSSHLSASLDGHGRIVFVAGESGSGKTALLAEFGRRAMASCSDLLTACGEGTQHWGAADPLLPVREVLEMLAGDLEPQPVAGEAAQERVRRLQVAQPLVMSALAEYGPDLIDLMVHGDTLLARVSQAAAEAEALESARTRRRLESLVTRRDWAVDHRPHGSATSMGSTFLHPALFSQVTRVLQAIARRHPLVLLLDDLQWADDLSIELIFHLSRHLEGQRILVIGAYRPVEVALGRPRYAAAMPAAEVAHPLRAVVQEVGRTWGDVVLDLDGADGRQFTDEYLDAEPNRFGASFREALHSRTHGHALFTIELLRHLQMRGGLDRDAEGRWFVKEDLEWDELPARVQAVIARRFDRLSLSDRALLDAASVEGEGFTAEIVAAILGLDAEEVITQLSGPLGRQHRIVHLEQVVPIGESRLVRYSFIQPLFRRYLYAQLDGARRAVLHEGVAKAAKALEETQLFGKILQGDPVRS